MASRSVRSRLMAAIKDSFLDRFSDPGWNFEDRSVVDVLAFSPKEDVNLISVNPLVMGIREASTPDFTNRDIVVEHMTATVQFVAHNDMAVEWLDQWIQWMRDPDGGMAFMAERGFSPRASLLALADVSTNIGSRFQLRYVCDMVIAYTLITDRVLPEVQLVGITSNVGGHVTEILIDLTE